MIELKEKLFSDEIKRLTPVIGRDVSDRLSKAYLIGDEITRKRIIEMLDIVKAAVNADPELRDRPLLEPPAVENNAIEIGELIYGGKSAGILSWPIETFMTHVGIFGSSGYGKTNISYLMIKKLSDAGVPVIVFDFSKKNYRDLMQTDLRDRINIYTLGSRTAPLNFNPLKAPPGVSKSQWAKEFSEIFDHAYWLLGGGQHIIHKALNKLYEQGDKPVLADLKRQIEGMNINTSREKNWIATSLRPLESLCINETGEMFSLADGTRPSAFFEPGMITILEMDALSTNDKTFLIEITIQWIRDWLVSSGQREKLQGVIILEEAHHVLNREKARKIGSETVMDLVFREMRELGLGIVYLDQHPSMISYPAMGNTSTHIYMNLGLDTRYSSDVQDAANMLGIEDEQTDFIRTLSPGYAFVLMRNSIWKKPFTARFDLFTMKKGMIRDEDVEKMMKPKLPTVSKTDEVIAIDEIQQEIIKAVGTGRGVFTSQLYKPLKLSGATFKEKMEGLVRKGIVGVREVRVERTKANYYYLTDLGEKMLAEKFPTVDAKSKVYPIEGQIEQNFREMGWGFRKIGKEYVIQKENKNISLVILSRHDRKEISQLVNSNTFYICATPEIRNILLQYAAKQANHMEKMSISAALFEGFPKSGFEDYLF